MKLQKKQNEWNAQWNTLSYKEGEDQWLFTEWIYPNTLETFRGKKVLDAGCGGGQHVAIVAPYAKKVVGIDLNTPDIAIKYNQKFKNVQIIEGDIAKTPLDKDFDVIYSVGVLHHTDSPTASFRHLAKHAKKGGRVIVWVYSKEGNLLNRVLVEPLKTLFILKLSKKKLAWLAHALTRPMYIPIYTIYRLPLRFLPFYYYFQNWRKLSYRQNYLNVFDKLNAPQTFFIPKAQIREWFNAQDFTDVHISPYKGVSWRGSGTKR